MKQLLLEIDDITEAKINAAAKTAGLSTQQWLQQVIAEKTATTWPNSIKALAGTWQDAPFAEALRAAEGKDIARQNLI